MGCPYGFTYKVGSQVTKYYYITNLQGDIVEVLNATNGVVARYRYDAWGKLLSSSDGNENPLETGSVGARNPLRYRGYIYDSETGLYYLQSRYYDPVVHRFINADGYVSTGTGFNGYNMYAYCNNDPVNMVDDKGSRLDVGDWKHENPEMRQMSFELLNSANRKTSSVETHSGNMTYHGINEVILPIQPSSNVTYESPSKLPTHGDPNSSQIYYNPDGSPKQQRWYGSDGEAVRDRDYNHPGQMPFPHDHEWNDGRRGTKHLPPSPDFTLRWEPLIGFGIVTICSAGIVLVSLDNISGIGFADDFLFTPLGIGLNKGMALILD